MWCFCMHAVPQAGQVRYEAHLLDSAASPLVAALPQYERGFRDHRAAGRAYCEAIQVRPLGLNMMSASLKIPWEGMRSIALKC